MQPRGAADVKLAVDFARASNLLVAVKCGGHSPSGNSTCNDGLLIDLSLLRGVRVEPSARLAPSPVAACSAISTTKACPMVW